MESNLVGQLTVGHNPEHKKVAQNTRSEDVSILMQGYVSIVIALVAAVACQSNSKNETASDAASIARSLVSQAGIIGELSTIMVSNANQGQ